MKIDNKLISVFIIIAVLFLILCAVLVAFGGQPKQEDSNVQDPYVRCAAESSTDSYERCKVCMQSGGTWTGVGCLSKGYGDDHSDMSAT